MDLLFISIASTALTFPFILLIYDKVRGTHYSCTLMGWHNGKGSKDTCSKCHTKVLQDSQGSWFNAE